MTPDLLTRLPPKAKVSKDLPWNSQERLDAVLAAVANVRCTNFAALQGELLALHPEICGRTDFLSVAGDAFCFPTTVRDQVFDHPVFRIWFANLLCELNLDFLGQAKAEGGVEMALAAFSPMLERVQTDLSSGRRPQFASRDIDPIIAERLPPSYVMPEGEVALAAAVRMGHPLSFFQEVVNLALDRIMGTWPNVHDLIRRLVAIVLYLPDGNFRSCSASRYPGVVLISARDSSIVDLEESFVHEAGHQLLYQIAELGAITVPLAGGDYRLPWSIQVRDIYGYFHAYFIYVLLARYLERVMDRDGRDGERATARVKHILTGLAKAREELESAKDVTAAGRSLLEALGVEVAGLLGRHPRLVA